MPGGMTRTPSNRLLARRISEDGGGKQREWAEQALCANADPELFFPPDGDSGALAKQICSRCTVQPECLAYAIDANEEFGIWGGMTWKERNQVRDV